MKTKNDKRNLLLSTVLCLLPIALYLAVYDSLPEQMAMQWSVEGTANWYAPKAAAVFGLPAVLTVIHLINVFVRHADPKRENTSKVLRAMLYWLVPVLSIAVSIYSILLNTGLSVSTTLPLLLIGVLIIVFGNYMPKNKQNYIIGIRIPWTLSDADNWNKTHRVAAPLWIIGGIVLIIGTFIVPANFAWLAMFLAVLVLIIGIPVTYSYRLYKAKSEVNEGND